MDSSEQETHLAEQIHKEEIENIHSHNVSKTTLKKQAARESIKEIETVKENITNDNQMQSMWKILNLTKDLNIDQNLDIQFKSKNRVSSDLYKIIRDYPSDLFLELLIEFKKKYVTDSLLNLYNYLLKEILDFNNLSFSEFTNIHIHQILNSKFDEYEYLFDEIKSEILQIKLNLNKANFAKFANKDGFIMISVYKKIVEEKKLFGIKALEKKRIKLLTCKNEL